MADASFSHDTSEPTSNCFPDASHLRIHLDRTRHDRDVIEDADRYIGGKDRKATHFTGGELFQHRLLGIYNTGCVDPKQVVRKHHVKSLETAVDHCVDPLSAGCFDLILREQNVASSRDVVSLGPVRS